MDLLDFEPDISTSWVREGCLKKFCLLVIILCFRHRLLGKISLYSFQMVSSWTNSLYKFFLHRHS